MCACDDPVLREGQRLSPRCTGWAEAGTLSHLPLKSPLHKFLCALLQRRPGLSPYFSEGSPGAAPSLFSGSQSRLWGSALADSPALKATRAEVLPVMPFTIRAGSLCKLRRSAIDSKTCYNPWRLKRYQKGRQGTGFGPFPPQALGGRENRVIPLRTVGPQSGIWGSSEKPSLPPRSLMCDSGHSAHCGKGREVVSSGLATAFGLSYGSPRVKSVSCSPIWGASLSYLVALPGPPHPAPV